MQILPGQMASTESDSASRRPTASKSHGVHRAPSQQGSIAAPGRGGNQTALIISKCRGWCWECVSVPKAATHAVRPHEEQARGRARRHGTHLQPAGVVLRPRDVVVDARVFARDELGAHRTSSLPPSACSLAVKASMSSDVTRSTVSVKLKGWSLPLRSANEPLTLNLTMLSISKQIDMMKVPDEVTSPMRWFAPAHHARV